MESTPRPVLPGDAGSARPGGSAVRRSGRRRRPTGAPPPLPRSIQTTGVWWAAAAVVLVTLARITFGWARDSLGMAVTVWDDAVVGWLAGLRLPPVFLLGLFSYLRLVQTSIEDLVYAAGSFRIRQYFLGLDPAAVPFFPPTDPQGMTKLDRMGVVATGPLQLSRTARRPGRSPDMTARPNIVLVHGAWADGASWSAVMPTVVAGHSYGGQIITALGTDAPNAVGMVYIAGFGLDEGESIGAPLDQAPAGPALAHLDVDPVKAVEGSA